MSEDTAGVTDAELKLFELAVRSAGPDVAFRQFAQIFDDEKALRVRHAYEKKVGIYEKAGVPEYVIFDPPTPETDDRLLLTGYRLGRHGYRKIQPDARGFLLSRTTNLLFGVAEDGRTAQVIDAVTGERLLSSREEAEGRKAAEEQLVQLRAELERLKAVRED